MSMRSKGEKDYGGGLGDYSCFAYGLIREFKPQRVLEVGLGPHGYSARAILNAIIENEQLYNIQGKYTFIELEKNFNSFSKVEKFPTCLWEARWGDSRDVNLFCEIKDRNDESGPVDIAFIDGNHTEEYCYNDTRNLIMTNTIQPEKGLIVFHDTMMNTVKRAVKRLKDDFDLDVFHMPQRSLALARIVYK
jgi:predicted O-methyltransferase YrrM